MDAVTKNARVHVDDVKSVATTGNDTMDFMELAREVGCMLPGLKEAVMATGCGIGGWQ